MIMHASFSDLITKFIWHKWLDIFFPTAAAGMRGKKYWKIATDVGNNSD